MKRLGRNFKYWIYVLEKPVLEMLVGIIVTALLMGILDGRTPGEFISKGMPGYVMAMTFISIFTNMYSCVETYFPLSVSMGSDRKNSFIAMQMAQHLVWLESFLIGVLPTFPLWFEGELEMWITIMVCPMLMLSFLLMGLGMIGSVIVLKFGKNIGTAVYVGMVVLLAIAGIIIVVGASEGMLEVTSLTPASDLRLFIGLAPLLGAIFDALMVAVLYRCIRKRDLQFI